jgi:hypothetical protein
MNSTSCFAYLFCQLDTDMFAVIVSKVHQLKGVFGLGSATV